MSTLNTNEKQLLEKLFQMSSGYVLNFSDGTMFEYFKNDVGIDIYDQKYYYASGSKANRLRGLWQVADDTLVGKSIDKLVEYIDSQIVLGRLRKEDFAPDLMDRGRRIASRLLGRKVEDPDATPATTEDEFIAREFKNLSIDELGLDGGISAVLNQRLEEIRSCLTAKAPLAAIFLCGSTLEGILFGIASNKPKDFNQSALSPKDDQGKVKHFYHWTLSEFINVARDLGLLGEDVKKFGHALRDFRNYIHPYKQVSEKFDPNEQTAKICWAVLQAAITQLSK